MLAALAALVGGGSLVAIVITSAMQAQRSQNSGATAGSGYHPVQGGGTYEPPSTTALLQVVKDPAAHQGEHMLLRVVVSQFDSATGPQTFRADVGGSVAINAAFTGQQSDLDPVVQGDTVEVLATVIGPWTYTTQIGGATTVPLFGVDSIHVVAPPQL